MIGEIEVYANVNVFVVSYVRLVAVESLFEFRLCVSYVLFLAVSCILYIHVIRYITFDEYNI